MTSRHLTGTLRPPLTRDDSQLARAIQDYLELLERGAAPPRGEYCARFPEIAIELDGCLAQMDWIREMALELSNPGLLPSVDLLAADEEAASRSRVAARRELGDFRLIRELGRGGMGVVYEAEQLSLGRRVALKVLPTAATLDPRALQRFKNEAQAAAALDHPHIVDVYGVGCERGVHYYAMRLIDGLTLADVIGELRPVGRASGRPGAGSGFGVQGSGQETADRGQEPVGQVSNLPSPTTDRPAPDTQALQILTTLGISGSTPRTAVHYRTIAALMADAADALHHAHEQGIIHRDIKPSNLMLDSRGKLWITDFGLAHIETSGTLTATGDLLGTLRYMSPEQASGKQLGVDHRTDIYSLGVTLFEMLALRPAFAGGSRQELLQQIASQEPPRLRKLVPQMPADLETVVLKAIEKDPAQRYATAGELAADLRRFVADRPVQARPPTWLHSARKWSRRHRPVVLTAAVAGLLLMLLVTLAATRAAIVSNAAERQLRRESLIQQLQIIRLAPPWNTWFRKSWRLVEEASEISADHKLRSEAAAMLGGIDVGVAKDLPWPGTAVAFSQDGMLMAVGGTAGGRFHPARSATLVDAASYEVVRTASDAGPGPVAFRGDTPVHLVAAAELSLALCEIGREQPLVQCRFPAAADSTAAEELVTDGFDAPLSALSDNASRIAGAARFPDKTEVVAVWDGKTGERILQQPYRATALALSTGGALLAAGSGDGRVRVWAVDDGRQLAEFQAGSGEIHNLAFGPGDRWLAVGGAEGLLQIWDWRIQRVNVCRGSQYDVLSLAFSPDGVTLASAGRANGFLWDVATCRELLRFGARDHVAGIAYSGDGRRLACISESVYALGALSVFELDDDRGIQTLRGLDGFIPQVWFSADGSLLAGLAQDWRLGVWNLQSGRLLHVLPAPRGISADNAGLAFSRDGRQVAFATSGRAKLWDLASGKELGDWELPPGLQDQMAFHPTGKLLLFRVERADPTVAQPVVIRVRELAAPTVVRLVVEIKEFPWGADKLLVPRDGDYVVVRGRDAAGEAPQTLKVFRSTDGSRTWQFAAGRVIEPLLAPAGDVLAIVDAERTTYVDLPLGPLRAPTEAPGVIGIGSAGRYVLRQRDTLHRQVPGMSLFFTGHENPLLNLPLDQDSSTWKFSDDGDRLALGHSDGSIAVYRLSAIRQRLRSVGLDW